MPAPPKPITFTFEGKKYEASNGITTGLVLLPDGRLLRAGGFDDGVAFAITEVHYVTAREALPPVEEPAEE